MIVPVASSPLCLWFLLYYMHMFVVEQQLSNVLFWNQVILPIGICVWDPYFLIPKSWEYYSVYLCKCLMLRCLYLGFKFILNSFLHKAWDRDQRLFPLLVISPSFMTNAWNSPILYPKLTPMCGLGLSSLVCLSDFFLCLHQNHGI